MRNHNEIDLLLEELGNDATSTRRKAEILIQLIDTELEKPEEKADMDLIQECFDYLESLNESESDELTRKKKLEYHLTRIYQRGDDADASSLPSIPNTVRVNTHIWKRRLRTVGIVAAIFVATILVFASTLSVIARVNGYDTVLEWLSTNLNEYFQLETGKEYDIEGITVVRNTGNKTYDNIETWLQEEGLNLLYPSVLPEGVQLQRIVQNSQDGEKTFISWIFSDPDIRLAAQDFDLYKFEIGGDMEILEINGYQFGILNTPENSYQAFCVAGDFAYSIECTIREDLLTLINHLKGLEK